MTQNASEQPGAPRPPSVVRRRPLLFYKPYVLKIIHFLEQSQPFLVVSLTRLESQPVTNDDPAITGGDQV